MNKRHKSSHEESFQEFNFADEDFFVFASDTESDNQMHTIIVGGKTFRLSWESIKSDGPVNFFIEYFNKNKKKTMYIDKDPEIFELVVRHLRGYSVQPIDDVQNRCLLLDAHYYGLNRLVKILQDFLWINVGGRLFRLPWSLLQKDGTRNFFTGPLTHNLLQFEDRQAPLVYIDRDPDIFEEMVNHLRGYSIQAKNETHRKNLLRDAQYYVFRQLVDKLMTTTSNEEVLLLIQDVRLNHVVMPTENTQIQYRIQDIPHALLLQISDISIEIHRNNLKLMYELSEKDTKKLKSIHDDLNNELHLDPDCAITIDNQQVQSIKDCVDNALIEISWEKCEKNCGGDCQMSHLIINKAICSIHLVDNMITLFALKLAAISSNYRLNLKRQFLSK